MKRKVPTAIEMANNTPTTAPAAVPAGPIPPPLDFFPLDPDSFDGVLELLVVVCEAVVVPCIVLVSEVVDEEVVVVLVPGRGLFGLNRRSSGSAGSVKKIV